MEAGKYGGNMTLFVQRITAAVEQVKMLTDVDMDELAIMGYCL
jgi:dienelactone hydrolase